MFLRFAIRCSQIVGIFKFSQIALVEFTCNPDCVNDRNVKLLLRICCMNSLVNEVILVAGNAGSFCNSESNGVFEATTRKNFPTQYLYSYACYEKLQL